MKLIIAYIKPDKLDDVTLALHQIPELSGVTVSNVEGFGRGRATGTPQRHHEDVYDFLPRSRLELFCPDELAEPIKMAIKDAAHTGLRGDGKIFTLDVEGALRIGSGESRTPAV